MEVQNITGPDIVPTGFSDTHEVQGESVQSDNIESTEETSNPQEPRGTAIDVYA